MASAAYGIATKPGRENFKITWGGFSSLIVNSVCSKKTSTPLARETETLKIPDQKGPDVTHKLLVITEEYSQGFPNNVLSPTFDMWLSHCNGICHAKCGVPSRIGIRIIM